ncbi:hypothetical protein Riv7116_1034 [Rivularia sp. PCC 7116]|uniref:hypothetical protein n=1 Tax=Rivularia sp. PCC 7116 TaxID=373994 RepID=UPI00029ED7D4|nr:hypothetical protein [Rivularia sp. PCC 7116]AFY53608.1 hypothetical protein Riv7116_1034 [Rivularia sp. PCC 7116]
MVKQASFQSGVTTVEEPFFKLDNLNSYSQSFTSKYANLQCSQNHTTNTPVAECTFLQLDNLQCFEVVDRQYESKGVLFSNCIAIEPSNPAFPPHSGLIVLMSSPKSGLLEATFVNPVHSVSAFVTSSQRLMLSAYDESRQLLDRAILPSGNLANSDSSLAPNTLLSVTAQNIHSICFHAFEAQFTVDDLSFSY